MSKTQIRGTFSVALEIVYDPESGEIKILSAMPSPLIPAEAPDGGAEFLLSDTMARFGIITLGKRNAEKLRLPAAGTPITVLIGDERYPCKLHASVPGRVDGLTKAFRHHYDPYQLNLNEVEVTIVPTYNPIRNELRLEATATPKTDRGNLHAD